MAHLTVSGDRLLIALLFTVEALPGTVWIALVTPVYFRLVADWLASVDVARHDLAAVAGHVDEVDAIIQHVVNGWSELTMWQHLKPTDPGSTGVSPRA